MRPWLLLPPQLAHDLIPFTLPFISMAYGKKTPEWNSFTWKDMTFANPLGIAGGVDKNAEHLNDWWRLGAGFVEIGTVTPLPQNANPGKIMDRDKRLQAMWNKMGFPSHGADEVFYNLASYAPKFRTPIFINIGKNRSTPNNEAVSDYLSLVDTFRPFADAFVVNVSSPNTKGLRDLQNKDNLRNLLCPIIDKVSHFEPTPVLVKLSPDMGEDALAEAITHCNDIGIDGFVLTNTTLSRPQGCHFPEEGGLSGAPLKDLSLRALQIAVQILGKNREDKLLVSAGGVMTPDDVFERLQMGANLVQIYSALVFQGPGFFHEVARRYNERR
ncbi:quinone-dependent dihydroorotate dehydrogenase [Bdellovibrio sp. NC01]|uniref:quinone-dependent dihydroorotate dehydrogenase n=1 Tax=Bdellovibrio sp. NC01 TaxID=2220073 RepID=UPI00115ABD9E|nr:quinone-dependent dihydroorotate dehydrogenase [Bdellovibrio sp. NC01]QDK36741.1 quinone-dependent dihydroorotate dehydrogenase [Bdellovibrio sp. NC01]